jgi:hypothetical protein
VNLAFEQPLRWTLRKALWDGLGAAKFAANRPAAIPLPTRRTRRIEAVSLGSVFPDIAVPSVRVADHVPADEAQPLKRAFYDVQVALYSLVPPMQAGLPSIASPPELALAQAYGRLHRKLFPPPLRPVEYAAPADLGRLAVASPYACYLRSTGAGHFEWDFRELAGHTRHAGLRAIDARVDFVLDRAGRRLLVDHIETGLGRVRPGESGYALAQSLALCAATTHLSLVRHFCGVHLCAGGPLAMASRNELASDHPLLRLLWPHFHGTQYSNEIVTLGQMAPGGDFESIFSFDHAGMCALFEASYARYDLGVLDPERDAERRGVLRADFDTPALDNRVALFELKRAHAARYLALYYADDAALARDAELGRWLAALAALIPNGIATVLGPELTRGGLSRLLAAFIYMATVEHEIVGTGLWNYQLWSDIQPVRISADGSREPLDVYQRLVNANFNLNVRRAPLMQDFSHLALDARGAEALRTFQGELAEHQAELEAQPFAAWRIYPKALEANINA